MKKLKLSFKDDDQNKKMISIDYPKDDVESEQIIEAMDTIIKTKVLKAKEKPLTQKVKAYEETIERKDLPLSK